MNYHYLGHHEILLDGRDYQSCRQRVESFFEHNKLIRYDHIRINREGSLSAREENFWRRVEQGLAGNREEIRKLTELLAQEGFAELSDWKWMSQGYISKTVHTLAHLIDGFIGIDSIFYNCLEDSHTLSPTLRRSIETDPGNYWLIRVEGFAEREKADRLPFLRKQF